MSYPNKKSTCVLVLLLAWSQQTWSQDDLTPVQPGDAFVSGSGSGPAGTPEGEEQMEFDGVAGSDDVPAGASARGRRPPPPGEAGGRGPVAVAGFVNGPTGISVEAEEEEQRRWSGGGEPSGGAEGAAAAAPGGGEEVAGAAGVAAFVNGPTGISVEAEEEEEERMSGGGAAAGEPSRSSSRGVFSTAPEEGQVIKQQLPAGLHIDTADWSKESAHYSYKGGEWSQVDLPDAAHPAIPAPVVPGPALVVVTRNYLKKVHVSREVAGLANVTLHYRFFLTEGEAPNGIPELKAYQVVDGSSRLLAAETTRGAWSDRTIHFSEPGPFTIIFEGRLIKEGNEIAIDDVTISGISDGGDEGPGEGGAPPLDPDATTEPSEIPQQGDVASNILEEAQRGVKTEDAQVDLGTPSGGETEATTGGSNLTEISSGVGLIPLPSGGMEEAEGGSGSGGNMTLLIPTLSDDITVDESVVTENETAPLDSMPKSIVVAEETVGSPRATGGKQLVGKNETTEDENESELPAPPSEMATEVAGEGNNTESLPETTLAPNGTRAPEINTGTATESQPSNGSSSRPTPGVSSPETLTTAAVAAEEIAFENSTQSSASPETPEVSQATSTTNEGHSVPAGDSGGLQDASPEANVVVTAGSSAPSGDKTAAPGATSGTMPVARTPWGVFQVFLVLCVLGFVVLGFLYWRKRRRQDDEIPVFTRSSHADYLNPTFNSEDDSSFASYGGRHNYKSFD